MAILEMKNIGKSFSGVVANEGINLSVEKGEIHALLGENGAGKTTLMNILFGLYLADSGEIFWKSNKVNFQSPREAISQGIGMVHQHFSLVKKMTVLDNIILGLKEDSILISRKKVEEDILKLSEKYGLSVKVNAKISELSVGEQQRVEILKALYRKAELLILDEPTGILTPKETKNFFSVLKRLKEEGYAIIIITHRMSEIMEISDKVTILRDGKKVKSLVTAKSNPTELSYYMIGRELSNEYKINKQNKTENILTLKNVTLKNNHKKRPVLDNINLTINKGEILGIAGVEGNGQKELVEVIAGIRKQTFGDIIFLSKNINKETVKVRFKEGISYISDDRHADGLVMDMNIMENIALRSYNERPFSKCKLLNNEVIKKVTEKAIEKYRIKTPSMESKAKILSGGNQQKIILAREISEEAKCIVANQPTRGLDIGATEFVRRTLMAERNNDKSVILVSSDLEEILELSDRIAVMFGGKIVGILKREEADVQKIGLLMGGITGKEV